jgi:hypothetical protein
MREDLSNEREIIRLLRNVIRAKGPNAAMFLACNPVRGGWGRAKVQAHIRLLQGALTSNVYPWQ